jgi:serine protease Do
MPNNLFRAALTATAIVALAALFPLCAGAAAEGQADGRFWNELPQAGAHFQKAESLPDFVELAAKLSPAVVNISTEEKGETAAGEGSSRAPQGESGPFVPFGPQRSKSLGSGFIITHDGYILTNDHVVENPAKVTVTLKNGKNYTARIVGRDAKTDVALLKIDAGGDLPVAPLGNSDDVKVGQWVLAIGNPFGFDHSVTAGIISAKGRYIPGNFDQYLQTDASINPGNSGGPLIDLQGAVVGVNSAIYTRTGSNMGIGFAIPINLVKGELPQLRDKGKVTRGWLGIYIQQVTPELAESLGLKNAEGALVAEVLKGGPAIAAGIQRGDVIVEFNGKPVASAQELPLMVAETPLGKAVTVKVLRDKKPLELNATITESHETQIASAEQPHPGTPGAPSAFGIRVKNLSPELAHQLGIDATAGVVISSIDPGSHAEDSGLRARDVILEVNRAAVKNVDEYQQAIKSSARGKVVLLLVKRGDTTLYYALKPEG